MKNRFIASLIFLLFFSLTLQAQKFDTKKYINSIHKKYEVALQLDKKQSKAFKRVLKTYNPEIKKLLSEKVTSREFNKKVKLHDLEVYRILTAEQFAIYKKIKIVLEEYKKYKKS
ncbi:MAG: hypothetical protein JKY02_08035 [Flavobacteriaceae bacterium]|nr:hypothetical protein [Flavobacteriaceae bacterium]